MPNVDLATLRASTRFAKLEADRQMVAANGGGGAGLDAAGPPTWSRAAWDSFFAQYGRYPFTANELPPSFENCPDWAYELMGLRVPPVRVVGGAASTGTPAQVNNLGIFKGSV
jgi:hypothetical protein